MRIPVYRARPLETWPPAWRHAGDILTPLVANRTVILTGSAAGSASLSSFLSEIGAREVVSLALVAEEGNPIDVWLARLEALLASPPSEIVQAADDADPAATGVVYAGSYTAQGTFCGRRILGSRRPEQFTAERKDLQALYLADKHRTAWVIDVSDTSAAAHAIQNAVRRGATVVSGVPRGRLASGSSHTYLIARGDEERGRVVTQMLARDCGVALVAPNDRGIHCTYYGFVADDWVIDFGPFEALVYWNRGNSRIAAAGVVRPITLRSHQHTAARRAVISAARRLHETTGYSGAFCTDGVLQGDRYVVHEINPRVCAGFSVLSELCGGLPFAVLDIALREGGADASARLRAPLRSLSRRLRRQRRLLKLWDSKHRPLEAALRSAGSSSRDSQAWLRTVRGALACDGFEPLIQGRALDD
jgi:hypothetical protein